MLQALRIRDFRLLWGGSLVSSLGSWLLILAIPAHVFLATGSLRDTGLTLAARVPAPADPRPGRRRVHRPVGQAPPDDRDQPVLRRRGSRNAARHAAGTVLGTVCRADRRERRRRAVLACWQARTPAIVGHRTLLSSANSLNSFSDGAIRLIGGPLGGILLTAYGIRWLICADALSYLLSAAAMFMTSRTDSERARTDRPRSATWPATSSTGAASCAASPSPGPCFPSWSSTWRPTPRSAPSSSLWGSSGWAAPNTPDSCCPASARAS